MNNLPVKALYIAILVVAVIAILVGGFYFIQIKRSTNVQNTGLNNPVTNALDSTTNQSVSEAKVVYFGLSRNYGENNNKYSLVNTVTGQIKEFIPAGYQIIGVRSYETAPEYLLLQKGNELYSYKVSDGSIMSILTGNKQALLAKDEEPSIEASITEPGKFHFELNVFDPTDINEMYGHSTTILKTRSYLYDVASNKLVAISNKPSLIFSDCSEYDSKNQRFFWWKCGEGIGSSLPLTTTDLQGKKKQTILSLTEFGHQADDLGSVYVHYAGGKFVAMDQNNISKIIMIDPMETSPVKQTYSVSTKVKSELAGKYPYSIVIAEDSKTIIMGGGDFIELMRYNDNKQVVDAKNFPDPNLYANFTFPYQGKLYYQSNGAKAIKIINLSSWKIDKTVPVETGEEIGLIIY